MGENQGQVHPPQRWLARDLLNICIYGQKGAILGVTMVADLGLNKGPCVFILHRALWVLPALVLPRDPRLARASGFLPSSYVRGGLEASAVPGMCPLSWARMEVCQAGLSSARPPFADNHQLGAESFNPKQASEPNVSCGGCYPGCLHWGAECAWKGGAQTFQARTMSEPGPQSVKDGFLGA